MKKKRRYSISEVEANELLNRIEQEYSPLRDIHDVFKEIEKEEDED